MNVKLIIRLHNNHLRDLGVSLLYFHHARQELLLCTQLYQHIAKYNSTQRVQWAAAANAWFDGTGGTSANTALLVWEDHHTAAVCGWLQLNSVCREAQAAFSAASDNTAKQEAPVLCSVEMKLAERLFTPSGCLAATDKRGWTLLISSVGDSLSSECLLFFLQ